MNRPCLASQKLGVVVLLTAILLNMTGCAISGLDGGKYYALAYSVADYGGPFDLPPCGNDGKNMRTLLRSMRLHDHK